MADNEISTNLHELPEVAMNTHDELLLWHALHRLEVTYWYDVDVNEGRTAHEFFTPDGVKMVGHNRIEGREQIRAFYEWRARQSPSEAVRKLGISGLRAVRHLITNLYVASSSERCATVRGIVIFYGGPSKYQSNPPMVADLITECVLDKDNVWRFKSHTLRPVFMSKVTPPEMQIDPNFLKHHVRNRWIIAATEPDTTMNISRAVVWVRARLQDHWKEAAKSLGKTCRLLLDHAAFAHAILKRSEPILAASQW